MAQWGMTAPLQLDLPKSAVSQPLALLSLSFAILVISVFRQLAQQSVQPDVAICMAALIAMIALPHVLQQLPHVWQRLWHGNTLSLHRIAIKLLGLVALYSVILLSYLVFRGFARQFLQPLMQVPLGWVIGVALVTPFYVALTDRVMVEPEDALFNLGRNVIGTAAIETNPSLQQFLLGWLVKGFFGPLMIVFATNDLHSLLTQDLAADLAKPGGWYFLAYQLLFFVDVVFATTGYLCTFKLFDAHIRSAEPALLGWLVCIACYPPFWNILSDNFLAYDDGVSWHSWLANNPFLYNAWGGAIIACICVYAWATVSFGMRFSNLTHRGIITNGPYRFLKHPAYVSKNLSWWLVAVPFMPSDGGWQSLLNCLALLMVNSIYALRAITEERHLARDPAYVAYSAWIANHGIAARLMRAIGRVSTSKKDSELHH
jgi:Isoprenylcysteine carboxyl methyltransferase (ICMT) family